MNGESNRNRDARDEQRQRAVLDARLHRAIDFLQLVRPRLAIAEQRDQQAGDHSQRRNQHGLSNGDARYICPALGDVGEQDLLEEDIAKPDRQEHVRRDQTECEDASDQPAIDLKLGQHIKQWRNQQRDEGDMNRQDVLGRNRHSQ